MTKIKFTLITVVAASLMVAAGVGVAPAKTVDRIVAEVNNDIITMSELNQMAKAMEAKAGIKPSSRDARKLQRDLLEALIDRKLAKDEAKRRGIKVNSKELDEAVNRFKERNHIPDDATLAKGLANEGISMKEFRQQFEDQIIQERLLAVVARTKIMVTDAEVRQIYDEKFKQGGTQVHLVSVRLPFPPDASEAQKDGIKRQAESILEAVRGGESLKAVAAKMNLNPTDVGFVSQSDLNPKLAEYLSRLKVKEVAPVQTPAGFQLIQVVGRRTGEAKPFEEVAPQIRNILVQQEMAKYFSEWVKTLRAKAHIKIML
jgi:peptidyl-prolyl cis-trans isomerase SurA